MALKSCFGRRTKERLLYDMHTHAQLENDYCTTCTDTHTRTTRERLLYNLHTHARLENDYCTMCKDTNIDRYIYTHTHNTRSGELRCSRSASCSKKRRTTFMRTQGHGRQRKWRPPLRRLHLRYKAVVLEARIRVLHSAT
jgi:hypothetical protein